MRTTEKESNYKDLHLASTASLLKGINNEDQSVAIAVKNCIGQIEKLVDQIVESLGGGGRLFYIGAGTSGRLGILDASECPPTFGVSHDLVIGLIAGGDGAIRKAVEFAEDDIHLAWKNLMEYDIDSNDTVIGIAASGSTPYVVNGLKACQLNGIVTGCITCNEKSPLEQHADYPIVCITGPEFVTGSTRMKAGTAQKLILNMISTTVMIKLGRVIGNRMVDMQLSNHKLVERGSRMVQNATGLSYEDAKKLLLEKGSVRLAVDSFTNVD